MALPSATAQALQNEVDTKTQNFSTGLTGMISGHNQEYTDTGNTFDTQNGIPQLQKNIQGYKDQITSLQGTLNQLSANVTARAKGSLTNNAQVSRSITAEATPLQTNLNAAGIALAPMESSYATLETNKTNQLALLRDNQAREETGYTTSNQATLTALLDKLTTQRTLDAKEIDQANALALQQQSCKQSVALKQAPSYSDTHGGAGNLTQSDISTATGLLSQNDVQDWQVKDYMSKHYGKTADDAKKALGDKTLSASEYAKSVKAAMDYYGDVNTAKAAVQKAWIAGGYKQYGKYDLGFG